MSRADAQPGLRGHSPSPAGTSLGLRGHSPGPAGTAPGLRGHSPSPAHGISTGPERGVSPFSTGPRRTGGLNNMVSGALGAIGSVHTSLFPAEERAVEAPSMEAHPDFVCMSMSGSSGLVLGRGSWATAYRQSTGQRREALRLLYTSGIVTPRELSDDLTVIDDEHVEDCVRIAVEMLQTWTIEMWARQPQEAKKFFEERLTMIYENKYCEQNAKRA